MKKVLNCIAIMSTILFFACSSDKNGPAKKSEYEALKQKLQNDSILMADMGAEMEQIGKYIDEISSFTAENPKGSTPEKLKAIEDLIISSNKKINDLETKIANSNSTLKDNVPLNISLNTQKKLILEQQKEIERLTGRVIDLEKTIDDKDLQIGGLKTTVDGNNKVISNLSKSVSDAEKRLRDLNAEISAAKSSKTALDNQINQEYASIAGTLVSLAEDISFNGDTKREMANKAFDYYCKLHKRGYYNALTELSALKSNKKLKKYLVNRECN
jgi:chromosome segregation ATPase